MEAGPTPPAAAGHRRPNHLQLTGDRRRPIGQAQGPLPRATSTTRPMEAAVTS